jgi:hypothetical protein
MAWETRGGRRYYYRKVWKDGRCFSVYEGGGFGGELSAEQDASQRATEQQHKLTMRQESARHDQIDALLDESWAQVKAATDEALAAAGYHRHKRQWRLKRDAAKAG